VDAASGAVARSEVTGQSNSGLRSWARCSRTWLGTKPSTSTRKYRNALPTSFSSASCRVNFHSIARLCVLRASCQASTSRWSTRGLGMRRSRHWRVRMPISISAMFSQLACLGVWWKQTWRRPRLPSTSSNDLLKWMFRLSSTSDAARLGVVRLRTSSTKAMKSVLPRRSVTETVLLPAWGSIATNRLVVRLRTDP